MRCPHAKTAPPALLDLPVKASFPAIRENLQMQAHEDHGEGISEGADVGMRPEGVHRSAVRTSVTLYPERIIEGLKIAEGKAMAPKTGAATGRAARRLLPGI